MNRLHEHLLQLLREIRDICDANGITYYLAGGTLIGAARNQGFLPWDDDADISMTYDNWLKFREACKTQLPPNRYLGSPTDDGEYGHILPRYMSTDTTAINRSESLHHAPSGVVIDFFIMDPIADGKDALDAYLEDMYTLSTLVNCSNAAGYRVNLDAEHVKPYFELAHEHGQLFAARKAEEAMTSRFDERGSRYVYRWQVVPWVLQRSWFGEGKKVLFEGEYFNVPNEVNRFLTDYFGEEWIDVPGSVNPAKHNTAQSLDVPCADALEFYRPKYDLSELLRQTEERRISILEHAAQANALRDEAVRFKMNAVLADFEAGFAERRGEFEKALACRDGRVLAGMLEGLLAFQASADMVGRRSEKGYYRFAHPLLVPVDDKVFEGMLYAYIDTGRIRHAARILAVRRELELPFSAVMVGVENDLELLREAMSDYEHGRFAEGLGKATALMQAYPQALLFSVVAGGCARGLWEDAGTEESKARLESLVGECVARFPGEGVFRKLQADCQDASGDIEAARQVYMRAAESTRNGLTLFAIAKKTGYHPKWLRKAKWAKAVGVQQWDGPEPRCFTGDAGVAAPTHDACLEVLVGLLSEVVDAFDAVDAGYVLSPQMAVSCRGNGFPYAAVRDWGIVADPRTARVALEALDSAAKGDACRKLTQAPSPRGTSGARFFYEATDTVYIDLDGKEATSAGGLRIVVAVPEVLPSDERRAVPASSAPTLASESFAARVWGKFQRLVSGNAGVSRQVERLDSLVDCADMYAEDECRVRLGDRELSFDARFLLETHRVDCLGRMLSIPTDAAGFAKQCGVKSRGRKRAALGVSEVCATSIGYGEFVGKGLFDPGYYRRKSAYRKATKRDREILSRFVDNFDDIKAAVREKEKRVLADRP